MLRDHAFQFWLAVLAMGVAVALASIGSPDQYWFAVLVGLGLGVMMLSVMGLRFVVYDEQRAKARLRHPSTEPLRPGGYGLEVAPLAGGVRQPPPRRPTVRALLSYAVRSMLSSYEV